MKLYNYQTQQMIKAITPIMTMMAMGFGMVRPVVLPQLTRKSPNLGLDIDISEKRIDLSGRTIIARYNKDTNRLEINPKEFEKLPEGWGTLLNMGKEQVLTHEEGHYLFRQLSYEDQAEVIKLWVTLDEDHKRFIRRLFPTMPDSFAEATEWFAFEWTDLQSSKRKGRVYKPMSGKIRAYLEKKIPMTTPKLIETDIGISVSIPGERASADLTKMDAEFKREFDLGPGKWLWFNRLINQSGRPGLGTLLLDTVLSYCKQNHYSILNQVSAYGAVGQRDLEKWYISKGFKPFDYKKYRNSVLVWSPT